MKLAIRSFAFSLATLALCAALSTQARAQGRIVVNHDEWTLSNQAWYASPAQFALNVAAWFTGGSPGNFLVRSSNFGLTGTNLASTMQSAGHSWTINPSGPETLASFLQYDAIFLADYSVGNALLVDYVRAGGSVYLAAGTNDNNADDYKWDVFLAEFGLRLESLNSLNGSPPISNAHPLFQGVTSLYHLNGNDVTDLEPWNPSNQVLVSEGPHGLYAVYDGALDVINYCTAKTNSLGCVPAIQSSGYPSATNASPFTITAGNVLNGKSGIFFYGYTIASVPFQDGFKCVSGSVVRTPIQTSGGTAQPTVDCTGIYTFDFSAWILAGHDPLLVAGQQVGGQFWSRDPQDPHQVGLTDAVRFVIGP